MNIRKIIVVSSLLILPVLWAQNGQATTQATTPAKAYKADSNAPRSTVPDSAKWELKQLFSDDAAFELALKDIDKRLKKLASYKGKLKNGKKLRACLDLYFDTRLLTNKATLYSNLLLNTAIKNNKYQDMSDRALAAMNKLMSTASFIRGEILKWRPKKLARAYKRDKKLAVYKPYIDNFMRRKKRVLGAEAERVLSLMGDNQWAEIDLNELPSDHEKTFTAMMGDILLPKIKDANGKLVQLTFSNYGKYRRSPVRRVRRDTVTALFKALTQYQHVFAGTFSGQIRYSIALARSRGYDTALQAYMDKDNIDPKVYLNLIDTIHKQLKPLHRYVALRKKIMKVNKLHIYDMYTPMVKAVEHHYTLAEAKALLPKALAPLGEDYVKVLKEGLDSKNGWLDAYPHQDKESGAFSASVYGLHPYVKMNFMGSGDDVSTLAHEYGHALHSYLSIKNQPYVTFNYAPFNAEIASTCNEKLLHDYLYAHAKNDAERLSLLNDLIERIRTTIYRQALFAEFEYKAHSAAEAGTPLTSAWLNKTYSKLLHQYYGPQYSVDVNDGIEWAYVPHFYYKYYMFTYATGLSSGIAIAHKLHKGGDKAREDYMIMLRGGRSQPPLDLLKAAGVDLTKPDAIEQAAKTMDDAITEMEGLLAKKAASGKKAKK